MPIEGGITMTISINKKKPKTINGYAMVYGSKDKPNEVVQTGGKRTKDEKKGTSSKLKLEAFLMFILILFFNLFKQ